MEHWWKCKIIRKSKGINPFRKGDIILAKNGEEFIILFDGRREVTILKKDVKNLELLRRLNPKERALIERDYQYKRASKLIWNPSIIVD